MFNLFIAQAQAQDAAAAQPGWVQFVPFLIVGVIFYFLLIRPQKKRWEKEQNYIKSLKAGDEVYTKSGILGKIIEMTDRVVTLEVGQGVSMKFLKSHIGGPSQTVLQPTTATKS